MPRRPRKTYAKFRWRRFYQIIFNRKVYREMMVAQKLRKKWEYPVAADQRSTFKHSYWYDPHYRNYVSTIPEFPKNFNLNLKSKRTVLFEAENRKELLTLLLGRYSFKKYIIEPFNFNFPSNNLSYYYQHITHTKYVHGLPFYVEKSQVPEEKLSCLRDFVRDRLILNAAYATADNSLASKKSRQEDLLSSIFHCALSLESKDDAHLDDCEIDHRQENSMFWFKGLGFLKWTIPTDVPIAFQCHDKPLLQVRRKQRLPEFSNWLGDFSMRGEIPTFPDTPHVFNVLRRQYRNFISPGYPENAGDALPNFQKAVKKRKLKFLCRPIVNEMPYGHTQLHVLPETYSRSLYEENMEHGDITGEIEEHLKGHGIMSGWVWSAAQAHYDMRWMDKDVTRPYCSQSIVSDGQWFSFFCYQLNTLAIDPENVGENPLRNLCYGKTSIKLYDSVTPDGVVGLNDDALILLLKVLQSGSKRNSNRVDDKQGVEGYDDTLPVQEADPNLPMEQQRPLHKVILEEELKQKQIADLERATSQMSIQDRVKKMIGR